MPRRVLPKSQNRTTERKNSSESVVEKGRSFTVRVEGDRKPVKMHIDGGDFIRLLKNRCDYAIEVFPDAPFKAFFFVELKGEDVLKAAQQLLSTIENLNAYRHILDYTKFRKQFACIVSSKGPVPAITTRYQVIDRKIQSFGFEKLRCKTRKDIAIVRNDDSVSFC